METKVGIAGWRLAAVPDVEEGAQGYFWAWVVEDALDAYGGIVTAREPEVVRVTGAIEACDRRIYRTASGPGLSPASFRGMNRVLVLWRGPLTPATT